MNKHRVKPGTEVDLAQWDPDDHSGLAGAKSDAKDEMADLGNRMADLQELLYAEHKHKLLIILQGMDTSGKDGTISHVFKSVNPQGVGVSNFKAPTPIELDHDYLWRVHPQVPGKGHITIFNRSHYEEVLVVRVHDLVPQDVWERRYAQINDFERMLVEEGTTILKFFLYIGEDEQKKRLQARLDDPTKHWKFNPEDVEERKFWKEYIKAYESLLTRCSTEWAPWYIVPSNKKWYRNLVVATTIVKTLEGLGMKYPEPKIDLSDIKIK